MSPTRQKEIPTRSFKCQKAVVSPIWSHYEATCGSGSLLLKAADEAPKGLSIYGQEKDNATYALAWMNMILHDNETAELKHGNTLASLNFDEFSN